MVPIPYPYPVQFPDVQQEPATIVIRNSGRRPSSNSSGLLGILPLLVIAALFIPMMMPAMMPMMMTMTQTANNNPGTMMAAASPGTAVGSSAATMGMMMMGGMMMMSMMSTANTNVPHMQVDSGNRGTDGGFSSGERGSETAFF
ncbi:uncharacterized protein LOC134695878 [Mytilus trossulus]|uniref:uncharacterized protein LOC134695878 n=1 Tax=Mytilus trossulus TaxID=6551 RepID=UPI0030074092